MNATPDSAIILVQLWSSGDPVTEGEDGGNVGWRVQVPRYIHTEYSIPCVFQVYGVVERWREEVSMYLGTYLC